MAATPIFHDPLELRGQHVKIETDDGLTSGILRGIDSGWVLVEKVVYHISNQTGVLKHQTLEPVEHRTTCMLPVDRVRKIQLIYNVEKTC